MKAFILCAVLAVARAGVLLNAAVPLAIGTGASVQHRAQDALGNYNFGYTEGHATGGTFRQESGSAGVKVGSYGLSAADGRQRIVNYVADAAGFRADIKTNEPGVDAAQDPAATTINKGLVVAAAAPVAAVAAPLHYAAAPIAAAAALPYAAAPLGWAGAPLGWANPLGAYSYSTAVNHHGLALGHHAIVKAW